jgi:hypothetical protein
MNGMRVKIKYACIFVALLLFMALVGQIVQGVSQGEQALADYWAPVEKAMGARGDISPDGAIKFTIPRSLTVTLDGVRLEPGSDMSHEFEFMRAGDKAIMVGEIALKENEVASTTKRVLDAWLEETALHNHLLRESPHIMWLHIYGNGDPVEMAKAVRNITTSLESSPVSAGERVPVSQLDTTKLDEIMGIGGKADGGVYAYSIPRADKIRMDGVELSPVMDISTEVSFQPLGPGKAAVIGEFVLETSEAEPVLRTLADNGIEVTALHSHMLTEQPRLFYLHCRATGNATDIAQILRNALDRTNSAIHDDKTGYTAHK